MQFLSWSSVFGQEVTPNGMGWGEVGGSKGGWGSGGVVGQPTHSVARVSVVKAVTPVGSRQTEISAGLHSGHILQHQTSSGGTLQPERKHRESPLI